MTDSLIATAALLSVLAAFGRHTAGAPPPAAPAPTPTCIPSEDAADESQQSDDPEPVEWVSRPDPPCRRPPASHRFYPNAVIFEAVLSRGTLTQVRLLRLPRFEPPYPQFAAELREAIALWRYRPNPAFHGSLPKKMTFVIHHWPR
jgi:hypothetical protein